ncbi:MAG: hypothetical protein HYY24_11805 [Verrucomicrobia bacterium]|nr:hypothetical protein [Verrucomicrobiota bacterium]
MTRRFSFTFVSLACCFGALSAAAQWTTQTISLQPGWNAVYLEVQPEPEDCDTVFGGLPVESVWAWNQRFSAVQFIQDPNELLPGQPNWLTYLPPDHPARETRNLFTLRGGQAYLIKLKSGVGGTSWNLLGRPVLRPVDWLADSFNLVGFPLASDSSPSFQSFFSGSTAQAGQPAYRLNASGQWELITNPAATLLSSGKAYWVYCRGHSTFSGPLEVELEQRDGLVFGRILTEQTVRIRNASAAPASFTVRAITSQDPPNNSYPILAGTVPLSYFQIDAAQNEFGWLPLPEALEQTEIAPGQEWVLRLEAKRTAMADFVPPADHNGVLYQSLLEISNGAGVRYLVPVSAEGLKTYAAKPSALSLQRSPQNNAAAAPHPRAGLWVGTAAMERVNQPSAIGTSDLPVATASPFQFRLILHVDQSGTVRLLQKVLQMFKEGTLKPDPANPALKIVDQPGRFVLVTDDALIPQFSGATLRDGQRVARRISSPAFGFSRPVSFAGPGDFGAGKLSCQVTIDYDDRLNPFKHRYHPAHDNLDDRFETKVPEGTESFAVTRQIELEFTAEDPDRLAIAGWGDNQVGGIYRETVTGLHNKTIYAEGTFRLTQASRIGVLNDGR